MYCTIEGQDRSRLIWLVAIVLLVSGLTIITSGYASAASGVATGVQFGVPVDTGPTALQRVSCPSSTECVAVGVGYNGVRDVVTETETADRGPWTSSASNVVFDASGGGALNGVSCATTTYCVAVGDDANTQETYSVGTYSSSTSSWTWSECKRASKTATLSP